MKNCVVVLVLVIWSNLYAFGQTNPVQITGGTFSIGTFNQGGTAEMQSDIFTSTSRFNTSTTLNPWGVCLDLSCNPGDTFTVTNGWAIMSDEQHRGGTFTINGNSYQAVAFSGSLSVSRETFLIPRTTRRKGSIYLRKPFTLSGRMLVCQVDDFVNGCPADKILFNDNVSGRGTLTVKMKVKVDANRPDYRVYMQAESFEYRFER